MFSTDSPSSLSGFQFTHVGPDQQARGAFDGGKIQERKPVGMPHDLGGLKSQGPLFYWAWAWSDEPGLIALHPHRGFEIFSYVIEGRLSHRDTLGTGSTVQAGGVQAMQTASGVSHEERTGPGRTEFFQIWLQPDLETSLREPPQYHDFRHEELPQESTDGVEVKTILGKGSNLHLETSATFHDIRLEPQSTWARPIPTDWIRVAVAMQGQGRWTTDEDSLDFRAQDVVALRPEAPLSSIELLAGSDGLRLAILEVPVEVSYRLHR